MKQKSFGGFGLASVLLAACASDPAAKTAPDLGGGQGGGAGGGAGGTGGAACEPLPTEVEQRFVLPAIRKVDFLFMIDNSGSMCEEQAKLTANFEVLARRLVDAGDPTDFRIAVTNTDLRTATSRGRFQDRPAVDSVNCAGGLALAPGECDDLIDADGRWFFGGILMPGVGGTNPEDLEHRFRCLAQLGTNGDGFEKGLEAMRLALSCDGPNRSAFAACCVDEMNAVGEVVKSTYDPSCAPPPAQTPEFLRPDAALVIVNLSDEVDCSDPASNPKASHRAICKYGPSDGADADSLPDGFQDPTLCPENDAAACYLRECGDLAAEACYSARCVIDRGDNNNCGWYPEALTPVQDYVDFLKGLKADPARQIIVASIVGNRAFLDDPETSTIYEVQNRPGRPTEACWYFREDGQPDVNVSQVDLACCPEGVCTGGLAPTCESSNGAAFTGRRYLEFAEAFGLNGLGCPPGAPENGERCVTICVDDFSRPLQLISEQFTGLLFHYCLEGVPECLVAGRACATADERARPENYEAAISASVECSRTVDQGGGCASLLPPTDVSNGLTVEANANCASGLVLSLAPAPPPGAVLTLKYRRAAGAECLPGGDVSATGR